MTTKPTRQLLGVGAIALLALTGCGSGGGASSSSATSEAPKKACEQPASDRTTIEKAPEVNWVPQHNDSFPLAESEEYGPAETKDSVQTCYRHSPEGALLASNNLVAYVFSSIAKSDADREKKVLENLALDNAGRKKEIDSAAKDMKDDTRSVETLKSAKLDVEGYRLDSYSEDKAVITLKYKVQAGGRTSDSPMKVTMQWKDSDWKVDVADGNSLGVDSSASSDGMVSWGPNQASGSSASASS